MPYYVDFYAPALKEDIRSLEEREKKRSRSRIEKKTENTPFKRRSRKNKKI